MSKIKAFNVYLRIKDFINIRMPAAFKDVELANRVAHDKYASKISGDFKADVELLLPKQIMENFSLEPKSVWAGITKGNMNIHLIEDDGIIMSGEMFKEPYVHKTAEVIRSIWESQPEVPDTDKSSVVELDKLIYREKITT